MTYHGHVKNGVIMLDESVVLPEGTKVRVELVSASETRTESETEPRTLYERYKSIIGKAEGLPSDFAENHDHYIHGAPKE